MNHRLFFRISAVAGALLVAGLLGAPGSANGEDNLAVNGGFEKGESGWLWQQWKGAPLPGHVDREDTFEGRVSFKLHQDGAEKSLYMARIVELPGRRDYLLSLALKPDGMPDKSARVRILIDEQKWYGRRSGHVDLVQTGGTHEWKTYQVRLKASALGDAEKITVFIHHDRPGQGTLGIDAVTLKPAPAARAAEGPALADAATYTTARPTVLLTRKNARIAIRATPDRALYRQGKLPRITIESAAVPDATLNFRVSDGFGEKLAEGSKPVDSHTELGIELPPGHGYYEVVATLRRGARVLGEARRSIGALPPPAAAVGDEPFGLWIQGDEHYPELGVRWTRDGVHWKSWRASGDKYLEGRLKLYRWYRKHNIRVIAYPKHPHPHQTSREVIEDTPEAWRDLRKWWTTMVKRLAGHVDAWGVINEPMRGHWKGSDELIVRYWALMREIVDRHDPDTPLIGPSLSPNSPSLVTQYRDLLDKGFGRYIDAIEMHTYINSPEDNDWAGNTRRISEMTREATGRDLPVWSTEHGTGGGYRNELRQAQGLLRSWLVAKKIGYPVVIWHMFSHPQGTDRREVQFSIFRNTPKSGGPPPQPRPAGVAYGVTTRQLAGADYRAELHHLGPAINAYVFERGGKAMAALWTTSGKTYEVTLPAGEETGITSTGAFGRVEKLAAENGVVRVTVDRNPKFIAPLPRFLLDSKPIAQLKKPVATLAGQTDEATLVLQNPTDASADLRLEWLTADGWRLATERDAWSLAPRQRVEVPLRASASPDLAIGDYQVYARVFLDDRHVTSIAARASVLPQMTMGDVGPRFEGDQAVVAGTLHRLDPKLEAGSVELGAGRSPRRTVTFGAKGEAAFSLPVRDPPPDRLEDLELIVRGRDGEVQQRERLRLGFVAASHFDRAPEIDGDLADWPGTGEAARIRWGWDEKNLYLAVRVPDRTHVQQRAVAGMWQDDSLQLGIAPGRMEQLVRAYLPGLQEADMVEFDLGLRGEGPALFRHRTVNKHLAPAGIVGESQVRRAIRRHEGVTSYELQIPVEQLGLKPLGAGEVLRAGLLINDNDGEGRHVTKWFGGLNEAKDPSLFSHLYLRE